MDTPDITHPAWVTMLGTVIGYGVILTIMTAALFLVPYLIFSSV